MTSILPRWQLSSAGDAARPGRDGIPAISERLGRRAFEQICGVCWAEWLKTQQQLINHYGLNLRDAKAKEFLLQNMEQFLFQTT